MSLLAASASRIGAGAARPVKPSGAGRGEPAAGCQQAAGSPYTHSRIEPTMQKQTKDATRKSPNKATVKAKFLELWQTQAITAADAAKAAGVTDRTIRNWRGADADFAAAIENGRDRQEQLRVEVVEDCLYQTLIGKAPKSVRFVHPAKIIFYLVNKSQGRWLNVSSVKVSSDDAIGRLIRAWEETQIEEARAGAVSEA